MSKISYYLPSRKVNNDELEILYGLAPGFIHIRTGILSRYYSDDTESGVDMAMNAIGRLDQKAVRNADAIIYASMTMDYAFPSCASKIMAKLEMTNIFTLDVSAACSGFGYCVEVAAGLLNAPAYESILIITCERMSKALNDFDYKSGVLFGDASTACILSRKQLNFPYRVESHSATSFIDKDNDVFYPTEFTRHRSNRSPFKLDGGKVYKNGIDIFHEVIKKEVSSVEKKYDLIIPHQANALMLEQVRNRIEDLNEDNFVIDISETGNTGSCSTPLALARYEEKNNMDGRINILLVAFGAGYTMSRTHIKRL